MSTKCIFILIPRKIGKRPGANGVLYIIGRAINQHEKEIDMNYIKQLQASGQEKTRDICKIQGELRDLVGYLNSDKFHVDTTVQVDDVLRRLTRALSLTMNIYK